MFSLHTIHCMLTKRIRHVGDLGYIHIIQRIMRIFFGCSETRLYLHKKNLKNKTILSSFLEYQMLRLFHSQKGDLNSSQMKFINMKEYMKDYKCEAFFTKI